MAGNYENVLFAIMTFSVGAWSTAVGYGYWLPPVKNMTEADAWKARHGRKLRVIGPLLLLIAFVYGVMMFFFT